MKNDTVVILRQPGEFVDPLTEVLGKNGARIDWILFLSY